MGNFTEDPQLADRLRSIVNELGDTRDEVIGNLVADHSLGIPGKESPLQRFLQRKLEMTLTGSPRVVFGPHDGDALRIIVFAGTRTATVTTSGALCEVQHDFEEGQLPVLALGIKGGRARRRYKNALRAQAAESESTAGHTSTPAAA